MFIPQLRPKHKFIGMWKIIFPKKIKYEIDAELLHGLYRPPLMLFWQYRGGLIRELKRRTENK